MNLVSGTPPYSVKISAVDKICNIIEKRPQPPSSIYNSEKNNLSKYQTTRAFDYGEKMGLIETDTSVNKLTERGKRFVQADNEERKQIIRAGVNDYKFYKDLLNEIKSLDKVQEMDESVSLTKSDLRDVIKDNFRGVDVSSNMMKQVITTFMKTMEFAGWGKYSRGNQSRKSRIILYRDLLFEEGQQGEKSGEAKQSIEDFTLSSEGGGQDESSSEPSPGVSLKLEICFDTVEEMKNFLEENSLELGEGHGRG